MNHPLISIVVPAYNIASHLPKTMDSILSQTYREIEIIVVNDGSTDATAEIINQYAATDSRIKPIHKENGGVTSARLRGVAEASGEWIGFVDGDDYIEPQMYERLVENALKYRADISHCGYQMVFHNRVDYYYNTGKLIQQTHADGLADLLDGKFVEPGLWNKLFHKDLFMALPLQMDPSIKINEDVLMNYWLFKQAESAVFEDVCSYHYVVRKDSAANSSLNKHHLYDPLRVTQIIMTDAEDALQPILLEKLCRQLITGSTASLSTQPELVRPFRRECRKALRGRLWQFLRGKLGMKLKIMALWASIWPASYCFVHKAYEKTTGLDKKYDLE